jgi:glutaredoxin
MIKVIGKTYSLETQKILDYAKHQELAIDYIDLEIHPDAEKWHLWLKRHKIRGIPVILYNNHFAVGYDLDAFEKLRTLASQN